MILSLLPLEKRGCKRCNDGDKSQVSGGYCPNPLSLSDRQKIIGLPQICQEEIRPNLDIIVKSRDQTAKKKDPDARRANPEE